MKTLKQFQLKKFPTNEYMDCPIPKHHWETIEEYGQEIRNESKLLFIAALQILHLHLCEQEGIGSGQPTPKQWLDAVDKLSKALHP